MQKYDIKEELEYEGRIYYTTECGLLLRARGDLPAPNHPYICYKKHNKKEYFQILEEIPVGLEKLIK